MEELTNRIQKETDELLNNPENNRIDLFEGFLKKYEKVMACSGSFTLVTFNALPSGKIGDDIFLP